jgi:hypothetical protein
VSGEWKVVSGEVSCRLLVTSNCEQIINNHQLIDKVILPKQNRLLHRRGSGGDLCIELFLPGIISYWGIDTIIAWSCCSD